MLKLPDGQTLFAPQTVQTIHEVQDADGRAVRAERQGGRPAARRQLHQRVQARADGLGHERGARPQLALALGRDVDVIAQNDSGAYATRRMLHDTLAGGEDRLAGKTVVVWELASRELAVGDLEGRLVRAPGPGGGALRGLVLVTGAAGEMGAAARPEAGVRRLAGARAACSPAILCARGSTERAARSWRATSAGPRRSAAAVAGVDTVLHLAAVILARNPD